MLENPYSLVDDPGPTHIYAFMSLFPECWALRVHRILVDKPCVECKRQGQADKSPEYSGQAGFVPLASRRTYDGAGETRDALIENHLGLVALTVSRMSEICTPGRLERDDAYSYGVTGLIQAVDAYDPSRGASLATFAMPRIRGAILDAVRRADPLPRGLRRQVREVEAALVELTQLLGHWPTNREIALRTGISQNEVRQIRFHAAAVVTSLDAAMEGSTGDPTAALEDEAEDDNPEAAIEHFGTREALCSCLDRLPPRDRKIIELYYVRSLTFREIGDVLHLTESRVSQLHRRIIAELRKGMRNELKAA